METIIEGVEKVKDSEEYLIRVTATESAPGAAVAGKDDKPGWLSPTYSVSRSVQLDPDAVSTNKCVGFFEDAPEVEHYRLLRTQILQRAKAKGGNTLMVTSAVAGEGKTLTAINLAFTFAKEFKQTVLLVDCDLRKQKIHQYLGYPSDKGLINFLRDDVPVSEVITWPNVEKMTVISGGETTIGSSELLGSPRMREVVEDMKTRYPDRFIIFDVPPVLLTADALAFVPLVDHILVVVRAALTSAQDVKKCLQLLPREKVVGTVLNAHKATAARYAGG